MNIYTKLTVTFIWIAIFMIPANALWYDSDYLKCRNWTITEQNNTARINMPVIYNATGLTGKAKNSSDFRIVNAPCDGGGLAIDYEILSNTSDSVYFATFINATASGNTVYSFYYNNTGTVNPADKPHLFLYANNGSYWKPDGGTNVAPVSLAGGVITVTTSASNKGNYTLLEGDIATGNWWFSFDTKVVTADANGVGFAIGDDYIGGGEASYQSWLGFIHFYGAGGDLDLDVDDGGGKHEIIDAPVIGRWYNIKENLSLPISTTGGLNITYNEGNAWTSAGGYTPDYNSMHQLRFFGSGGSVAVKNIFLSNHSFNSYNAYCVLTTGEVQTEPTPVSLSLVSPTPSDDAEQGFDYEPTINLSATGGTITEIKLEWGIGNDTNNYTLDILSSSYGEFSPSIASGNVYYYVGRATNSDGKTNITEWRRLIVSTATQEEIDSRITTDDYGYILLFLSLAIVLFLLVRRR